MGNLLAAEFFKIVRRPMTWIALVILVAIMVTLRGLLIALSFVSLPTAGQDQAMPRDLFTSLVTLPGALADTLNFIPSLGLFALLVVAASNAGTEFAWGTIVPLLSRGASRTQLVLAKATVLFGVVVAYLVVTVLVGLALGALASQLHLGHVPFDWLTDQWDDFLLSLLRAFWATVPYILGAIALAILFRSSALAMGIVLAYVFVEQLGFGIGISRTWEDQWEFRAGAKLFAFGGDNSYSDLGFNLGLNYYFERGAEPAPVVEAAPPPKPAPQPPETRTITVELRVLFDFDKAEVKAIYGDELAAVAEAMKRHPDIVLVLEGHTDAIGTEAYNLDLSRRRVEAVKAKLVSDYGIDPARIETEAYGESRPVADNATPEGRAQNRRVVGRITFEEVVQD